MALLYIPLRQNPDQRSTDQELTLDGVRVRLLARYTALADRWYLDTLDLSDTVIVGGLALVPGVDLWLPYKHLAIPQGALFVSDPRTRLPASLDTLDVSSLLAYREVGT